MKILYFILALFTCSLARAQFYYKDIIGTKETAELIKNYRSNKVGKVIISSYDADNTKSEDFYAEQVFDPEKQVLRTVTRSGVSDASVLTSFTDEEGKVIKTIDSSETSISTTNYRYSPEGLLMVVSNNSADTSLKTTQFEEHVWNYDNNKPAGMMRIKDKRDTTFVSFKYDEAGNIIEEHSTRKGLNGEPVYYYYDRNNRLTDIVRFNSKIKKLLPEYMFEYSTANQVIQKITVPANGSDYLIWRYQYNNNGLKTKEVIYNKQKQLTGKIEYQYVFAQ